MERLAIIPFAVAAALIAYGLNLTYVAISISCGIFLAYAAIAYQRNFSSTTPGSVLIWVGIALLAIAYFVHQKYGTVFDLRGHDGSIPKMIRRLPYYGVGSIVLGLTLIVIATFRR